MNVIGDVLHAVFEKLGLGSEEAVKKLLTSPELAKIELGAELSEKVARAFHGNLMTLSEAKTNEALLSHFKASVLAKEETKLQDLLKGVLSDETLADLVKKPTLFNKLEVLRNAFNDLKASKAAANPEDKKAIQAEMDKLQQQLTAEAAKIETVKAEYERKLADQMQAHEGEMISRDLYQALTGKSYIIPQDAVHVLVQRQLMQDVERLGAKVVRAQGGALEIKKFVDGHEVSVLDDAKKPVALKQMLESYLAPYIQKQAPQGGGNGQQQTQVVAATTDRPMTEAQREALTFLQAARTGGQQ